MNNSLKIIWRKETKNILGNKRVLSIYVIFVICIPLFSLHTIRNIIDQTPRELKGEVIKYMSSFFTIYYSLPLLLFISYSAFSEVFYQEKHQGSLPTLLSAPITLTEVLVGKSLAIATFAYPLTLIDIFVFLLFLEITYVQWSFSLIDSWSILHMFTSLPLLAFGVVLLIGSFILLFRKTSIVNLIAFGIIMALMYLGGNIMKLVEDTRSLYSYLLIISIIICLLGYAIARSIHIEYVVRWSG